MNLQLSLKSFAAVFFCLFQLSINCHAQQLDPPEGRVILTISGAIGAHTELEANTEKDSEQSPSAQFDLPMLEALGLTRIATETPWTDGIVDFEGVLVRDILDLVNADGDSVRATALNDYVIALPTQDFIDHDVIIATRIDGKPMKIRENGPLWIIYPWSDVASLRRANYYARSIWQLKSLTVLP